MIETDNIKALVEETKIYVETKVELAKLQAAEKLSEGIAKSVAQLIIGMVLLLFLFISSIFISIWFGEMLNNYLYGFGVVSIFYLLLLLIILSFKNRIVKKPIQNKVINYLYNSTGGDV